MKVKNMSEFKTKVVNTSEVKRLNGHHSKYFELYEQIRKLPFNKSIIITFKGRVLNFPQIFYQNLRFKRTGYKIRVNRQDDTFTKYALTKIKAR